MEKISEAELGVHLRVMPQPIPNNLEEGGRTSITNFQESERRFVSYWSYLNLQYSAFFSVTLVVLGMSTTKWRGEAVRGY